MSRFHPSRFVWVLALTLGLSAVVAQAQEHRYHYVSLDQAPLPSGFTFFLPAAINDSGRVYGTACDATFNVCNIAFYANGAVRPSFRPPVRPLWLTQAVPLGALW